MTTPQMGIRYVGDDGSLNEAGYALLEQMARELAEAKAQIAAMQQTLTDNGIT